MNFFFLVVILFFGLSCKQLNNTDIQAGLLATDAETARDPSEKSKVDFSVETIAKGLQNPWGMAFLPDGRILITERSGVMRIVKNGVLLKERIQGVPAVYNNGQGGLLDIVLHPDFDKNGWIYFSYAKPGKGGGTTTVSRARLKDNSFINVQELFSVDPYISSGVHFGCRIVFDKKGYMFISTGERGNKSNAQSMSTHNGKVLRLHDDGRVPADNPFVNRPGAKPEIWSYGHRNIQGMVYDESNNILWAHEHGPRGGDELNIIVKGKNYGWPVVTHGIDYNGSIISKIKEKEGIQSPVHTWTPSIAPCGMALVTTDKYAGWKGNLLVGALAYKYVARVEVKNRKFVAEQKLLDQVGRVRAVSQSPDGFIYVLTEGPGLFLKLIPKDK